VDLDVVLDAFPDSDLDDVPIPFTTLFTTLFTRLPLRNLER
jgi:hypothetical protein